MVTKSIPTQIIDEFIDELSKNRSIGSQQLDSLKSLLNSENCKKEDIVKLLKEDEKHENPRT
ncbi:MAG: hypothetical protein ABIF87_05375 [Pseudomonadota bacterium]